MYFRVNLKMKKSTLCCFAWIVFIELNFTVALLLIRKLGITNLPVRWGDGGFKEMGWGDTSNRGSKLLLCSWLFLTKSHISLTRV